MPYMTVTNSRGRKITLKVSKLPKSVPKTYMGNPLDTGAKRNAYRYAWAVRYATGKKQLNKLRKVV